MLLCSVSPGVVGCDVDNGVVDNFNYRILITQSVT
jgi:hypothetical protein